MNPDPAIIVNDLHKEFVLPQHKKTSFKELFTSVFSSTEKTQQKVLDGVSFTVNKGDFFGIVGRNGSGKSTLLKILAGVYVPTAGEVQMNGKLTPFIELGVGFNPELSGRDNVYLNGALLGFTHEQMDAMYDQIVEFAELERFMDQKLKNYSSGMQVRLAFSIAIMAKNDILIFDEVLAVGDEAFQQKCIDVFERYKREGQTVILVTHDMDTVRRFCNRAILIHDGRIVEQGSPKKVASLYSALNQESMDAFSAKKNEEVKNIFNVTLYGNGADKKRVSFKAGEPIDVRLAWGEDANFTHIVVNTYKQSGEHINGFRCTPDTQQQSLREVRLTMKPNVNNGKYFFLLQALNEKGEPINGEMMGPEFTVLQQYAEDTPEWSGLVFVEHDTVKQSVVAAD